MLGLGTYNERKNDKHIGFIITIAKMNTIWSKVSTLLLLNIENIRQIL